jgi:hypothetical protein
MWVSRSSIVRDEGTNPWLRNSMLLLNRTVGRKTLMSPLNHWSIPLKLPRSLQLCILSKM